MKLLRRILNAVSALVMITIMSVLTGTAVIATLKDGHYALNFLDKVVESTLVSVGSLIVVIIIATLIGLVQSDDVNN